MIHPSPTTPIAPHLARGTFVGRLGATHARPEVIIFAIANTSYEVHLSPRGPVTAEAGKRLVGTIRAAARRVDVVGTGGRYIEPVEGKPRRMQGTVIRAEGAELLVDATVPVHVTLTDARQKAGDFEAGVMVAFDLPDWPTFTQAG